MAAVRTQLSPDGFADGADRNVRVVLSLTVRSFDRWVGVNEVSTAAGSAPRTSRGPSLVTAVGVLSLVVVVAIGVVLGLVLQQSVRSRAINDAARTGEVAANVGVRPFLLVSDLDRNFIPLPAERVDALDASFGESLSPNGIVRIKIWNRQHWLVYSDNAALRGRWFAGADILERSFLGELTSEITDLSAPEEREERDFGELLAVYVPLRTDGDGNFTTDEDAEIIGAFEIYLPWAQIAADIRSDTIKLWATLGLGLLALYITLFQLVARASRQLQKKSAQNLYYATHDTLTGLSNRDAFHAAIEARIAQRDPDEHDTDFVMLFDLDDFQKVNDTLGHDVGDQLLQVLAARIKMLGRPQDTICRLGGDEFGLLLPRIPHAHVDATIRLYSSVLNTSVELEGISVEVRASVGVARLAADVSADVVLQQADIAMYEAKRNASHVEHFRAAIDTFTSDSLALAGEIRAALAADQFLLHFQPKYDLLSRTITGCEALVRWNHPERGLVPPSQFMPTAEQLPIGRELTNTILAKSVATLSTWHRQGLEIGVAVNLSARDVNDPKLAPYVAELLREYRIAGSWLTLELTEGSMLADEGRTIATLSRLRELGCGVAIDDFGTGYASISYLVRLPVSEVKIDRSFIAAMNDTAQSRKIVEHCVGIARSLGLSTTAEGIETIEIESLAAQLGCTTGQGYLRGKPMPLAEFFRFAASQRSPSEQAITQQSHRTPVEV